MGIPTSELLTENLAENCSMGCEAKLSRFMAAGVVGICFGDVQGNIYEANDEFLRLLNYSPADVSAGTLHWKKITPSEYAYADELGISEALSSGGCTPYEKELFRKDGSRVPVLVGYSLSGKNSRESVTFVLDLSEQKRITAEREQLLQKAQAAQAEAERANRIKDEFLAVVSHELRSPLNPILGWSQLLSRGQLTEEKTAIALASIERNAQIQVQLIGDLLDISRILRGKLILKETPVNLSTIVSAALDTVRLAAEAKSIEIITDIEPCRIIGDAGRLQQIVWNLLSNAVKFTPKGGQARVTLMPTASCVRLSVADTGKGIAPEFLPYVFEHFRQEDYSTTRQFGGLGLGLAIVRQLVEMHGGTISVQSEGEDQGSEFSLEIPLPIATNNASMPASLAVEETADLSGVRVLSVDDDADSLMITAFTLEEAGADVTSVSSGAEALQVLGKLVLDVLVSDIGMPEMDGYMLIQKVRALPDQQNGKVAAIALTAYAGEGDREQAISAGFQKHLTKPVEPDTLIQAVYDLIES